MKFLSYIPLSNSHSSPELDACPPSFAPSHTATALPSIVDATEPCLWNTGMSYVGRLPGGTSPFL